MKKDIHFVLNNINKNIGSAFLYTPPLYKNAFSYIAENPAAIKKAIDKYELDYLLKEIDSKRKNYFIILLLNYEAGYYFEDALNKFANEKSFTSIALFYNRKNVERINSNDLDFSSTENRLSKIENYVENFSLNTDFNQYSKNIEFIKEQIAKGNTYQVNYTIKSKFNLIVETEELFQYLIFSQSAAYSGYINLENEIVVSNSPELFIEISGDEIIARPMKGTLKRGVDLQSDSFQINALKNSIKNRAENIMIVDLLRNDLGRVAELDSVSAENIYEIEKYESLFQMTSSIRAKLKTNSIGEIIANIFPSGSITGAPKIKTMEIISEIEKSQRGIYTGSVGFVDDDKIHLNVAIRTPVIEKKTKKCELGIGSGIVWDSEAKEEYDEVILKSKYLTEPSGYFELFETLLVENGKVFLKNEHLRRLENSADYLMFMFSKEKIERELNDCLEANLNETYVIKIILTKWGNLRFEKRYLTETKNSFDILISQKKVDSNSRFQFHKTTNRKLYNDELSSAKQNRFDEVLFFNENGYLTEGTFTNVFIEINGKLITPAIQNGILNGCMREKLISEKKITEDNIDLEMVKKADNIFLTNSVRKIINVNSINFNNKLIWKLA